MSTGIESSSRLQTVSGRHRVRCYRLDRLYSMSALSLSLSELSGGFDAKSHECRHLQVLAIGGGPGGMLDHAIGRNKRHV